MSQLEDLQKRGCHGHSHQKNAGKSVSYFYSTSLYVYTLNFQLVHSQVLNFIYSFIYSRWRPTLFMYLHVWFNKNECEVLLWVFFYPSNSIIGIQTYHLLTSTLLMIFRSRFTNYWITQGLTSMLTWMAKRKLDNDNASIKAFLMIFIASINLNTFV